MQLPDRQHVGDDTVTVGRTLLDHLHHLLRPVAPVEHDEVGGGGPALRLIRQQCRVGRSVRENLAAENPGIEDRL
jgi:hypothetical protein